MAAYQTIPYIDIMTEALDPNYAVTMRFIKGQKAKYDMNPLTQIIEGLDFEDEDIAIPRGGPNEYQWQRIINQNVRREYLGAGIYLIGQPIINGLMRLATGIMDVLTLGALGFGDNYDKNSDKITGKIVEQMIYKHVITQKNTPVIGVPRASMPGGPGPEIPQPMLGVLGGAPYPGLRKGFSEKKLADSLYDYRPVGETPHYLQ